MSVQTRTEQRRTKEREFIHSLEGLDPGDRARLKRHAGRSLGDSTGVLGLFYRLLPHGIRERDHERYFLIATLFPLTTEGNDRDFGTTLSRMRNPANQAGLDRRFEALLDADEGQLPFRLRQLVRLTHAHRVGVNWEQLLDDVLAWSWETRPVQKRWAMSYFRAVRSTGSESDNDGADSEQPASNDDE